ncbi:hypothetical protein DASB73_019060 [Starmerella bacillaris]|uniref:60S acidic ribosomal protein P1 n=1 Tax=Starmerella bacillaris TaxID=1247836 RepID=A0AAV5RIG9_STABA|nr:hypothetical protein DASB73_019060 [Starmerella bacillaris]
MPNIAISYAAIILADAEVEVTADKLLALTKAANVEDIEPIIAQLYANAISKADTKELLTAFGASAAPAAAAGAGAAAGAAATEEAAAEEKKKEEEEESDDMDMGMLF